MIKNVSKFMIETMLKVSTKYIQKNKTILKKMIVLIQNQGSIDTKEEGELGMQGKTTN